MVLARKNIKVKPHTRKVGGKRSAKSVSTQRSKNHGQHQRSMYYHTRKLRHHFKEMEKATKAGSRAKTDRKRDEHNTRANYHTAKHLHHAAQAWHHAKSIGRSSLPRDKSKRQRKFVTKKKTRFSRRKK